MIEAKNKVFFLIPALTEANAGEDIAYLKVLQTVTETNVIDIFKSIIESQRLISEEDVDYFFDKRLFDDLYKTVKIQQNTEKKNKRRPSALAPLLLFLDNFKNFPDTKYGNNSIIINGKKVEKGLVNAYCEYGKDNNVVLVNTDALNKADRPLKVSTDVDNPQRNYTVVEVYPCDKEKLYIWLCKNRQPKRIYDNAYEKHSSKVKRGKKGKVVSAMTYSDKESECLLQWAIRACKVGHTEAYLLDVENHKLIIFYDERLETPTFHGHEIDESNEESWMTAWTRIRERGKGTKLDKRIKNVADIIKENREAIMKI